VRVYQQVGDRKRRDSERGELFSRWEKSQPSDRPNSYWLDVSEWQSDDSHFLVLVEEFFAPTGETQTLYTFRVYVKGEVKNKYKIALERAERTNEQIARRRTEDPDGYYPSDVHSLDYYPGSSDQYQHCTLSFQSGRPTYDALAADVRNTISVGPQNEAISCITRDGSRVVILREDKMRSFFQP